MPSRRIVSYSVEELPPIVTTTTTTRRVRKVVPDDDDSLSRDTIVRRQDQRIKDDITNKLYRIEMDRVKPSLDVQLQAAAFRSRPRTRTVTPEPVLRVAPRAHSVDVRRYSTAGNLDIYRPKTHLVRYGLERPENVVEYVSSNNALIPYVSSSTALVPYGWKGHEVVEKLPGNDLLSEYDLRRLAELKVRGRNGVPNGTRLKSTEVSYLPIVPRAREVSSPPVLYRYANETSSTPLPTQQPVSRSKRVLSDGQYELDQFEKLMHRNFGAGGLNRNKTLLYSSPPYASPYEPYVSPYSSTYTSRPYYSGSYSYNYPYTPYTTYTRPYYYSSYLPYSYYATRPAEYEYIYSPPTRVTAPLTHYPRYHYDTTYYGSSYPSRYYTYSYVR